VTPGAFNTSILRAAVLLRGVDLLAERRQRPDYSALTPAHVRSKPYPELWKHCLRNGLYDARLRDEAFFQFKSGPEFSYCFFEPPVHGMDFETFAFDQCGDEWRDFESELREEYDTYVASLPLDLPSTPLRFDYSPSLYKSPAHPAAHMHFGYSSSIRVATRRILSPEAFALFVIRQYYPACWGSLLAERGSGYLLRKVRGGLATVDIRYWRDTDECEGYIA
jgi:hypothetical protein